MHSSHMIYTHFGLVPATDGRLGNVVGVQLVPGDVVSVADSVSVHYGRGPPHEQR